MTIQFLFWAVIAVFAVSIVGCLHIGYQCGRIDSEPPRRPPLEGEHPYPEGDAFEAAIQAWLAEGETPERERLADTGELARLYEKPYPRPVTPGWQAGQRLTRPSSRSMTTGELRALAYNGDMTTINQAVAKHKKEIDQA